MSFKFKGLSKKEFLDQNAVKIRKMIAKVNKQLEKKYPGMVNPVSETDFWVLFNCEAGIKNGKIDPDFKHSEGERGVFPLPENIKYWNGSDAPQWDKAMKLETNLFHFTLYLGHLKNKVVTTRRGYAVYSGFFEVEAIDQSDEISARLLAGVVHGYFMDSRYKGAEKSPYDLLISGYSKGTSLSKMMRKTKYIHAGKNLMVNREKNIEDAIGWIAQTS